MVSSFVYCYNPKSIGIVQVVLLLIVSALVTGQTCPPTGFDAIDELDFDGYIAKRWYSIKQVEVQFQPKTQFYCVYAQYTKKRRTSFYCLLRGCTDKPTISVYNFARRRSVNGIRNTIRFEATITDPTNEPAKALIVPRIYPYRFRNGSNYWVVAAGTWLDLPGVLLPPITGDKYDWVIITAGLPKKQGSDNKCYSENGMWLFSHTTTPPDGAIAAIDNIASDLGLDSKKWLKVEHEGCRYDGIF
jgi:lipocalin